MKEGRAHLDAHRLRLVRAGDYTSVVIAEYYDRPTFQLGLESSFARDEKVVAVGKGVHTLDSLEDFLGLSLVTGLAKKGEHVLLVGLNSGLVERIDSEQVGADAARKLEEIEQSTEVVLVYLLDSYLELRNTAVDMGDLYAELSHRVAMLYVLAGEEVELASLNLTFTYKDPDGTAHEVTLPVLKNGTVLTVTGSVTFQAYAPSGYWLVFKENGKGGTFNAPIFVLSGENTVKPALAENDKMLRYGYEFDGWYKLADGGTLPEFDKTHECYPIEDDDANFVPFEFGGTLDKNTTIYAKWKPVANAPYTIFIYQQNVKDLSKYDLVASYSGTGPVGQPIAGYSVEDNRDEDYLKIEGKEAELYHYKGFNVKQNNSGDLLDDTGNAIVVPNIVPEGTSSLRVYYDRIVYNLKFYIYRERNGSYSYANNSGSSSEMPGIATWHNATTNHPSIKDEYLSDYTVGSDVIGTGNNQYTYHYIALTAYYGQDIETKWPSYNKINPDPNNSGRLPVSYIMMVGTKLKPTATSGGSGTVKGVMKALDDQLLGATNDVNGNYLVIRFPTNHYEWVNHIWYEQTPGVDYSGLPAADRRTFNGKEYYRAFDIEARSSNINVSSQNPVVYDGYTHYTKTNQNWTDSGNADSLRWTTTSGGTTWYHINQVYNLDKFEITYMDALYVDGNGNKLETRSGKLGEQKEIIQGVDISSHGDKESEDYFWPTLPNGMVGFVHEGWYKDEACTELYEFDKMPTNNVTVFGKWRQIQYRVFLHPNAVITDEDGNTSNDPSLVWGYNEDGTEVKQGMSFRISYNGYVSTPNDPYRDEYELTGWYLDEALSHVFTAEVTALNETISQLTDYDHTVTMTDPEDKWGTDNATTNSDATGWDDDGDPSTPGIDRYWVAQKLDLYAEWRAKLQGALGINIEYDLNGGSGEVKDDNLYLDKSKAVAQSAPTPPEGKIFMYWVFQKFVPETDESGNVVFAEEDGKQVAQGEYVDTDIILYPGSTFDVFKADSKTVKIRTHIDEHTGKEIIDEATYTIRLVAKYVDAGSAEPTHINWYSNLYDIAGYDMALATFGHDGVTENEEGRGWVIKNENIGINEAVDIPDFDTYTYEGYEFLGWAKISTTPDSKAVSKTPDQLTEDDLFLKWDSENEVYQYLKDDVWTDFNSQQVAADEKLPYDDLYALWAGTFTVVHSGLANATAEANVTKVALTTKNTAQLDVVDGKLTYNLTKNVTEGFLYGGYYVQAPKATAEITVSDAAYNGANWTWTKMGTADGSAIVPQPGATYYIKEVPASMYLQPYFHYTYSKTNNKIQTGWLLSDIDDGNYTDTGFVFIKNGKTAKVVSSLKLSSATSTSTVTLTAPKIFGGKGVTKGYLGYLQVMKSGAKMNGFGTDMEIRQYWKTCDGLYVTGANARTYTNLSTKGTLTKVDKSVPMQIVTDLNNLVVGS